jgi:dihydroneopterin aldolase
MDKIFLSALRVECIVGIWEWERRVKQTVVIDLEMAADIRRAAASDRIEDTLDYKKVAKRLLAFVGDSQFQLVETLTEHIARIIVVEFGVAWVKVRLNKQGAIRGARDVGIEIERRAGDYASGASNPAGERPIEAATPVAPVPHG